MWWIIVCLAVIVTLVWLFRHRAKNVEVRAQVPASRQLVPTEDGKLEWLPSPGLTVRSDGLILGRDFVSYDQIIEVKVPKVVLVAPSTTTNTTLNVPGVNTFRFDTGEGALEVMWKRPGARKPSQVLLCIQDAGHIFAEIQRAQKEFHDKRHGRKG